MSQDFHIRDFYVRDREPVFEIEKLVYGHEPWPASEFHGGGTRRMLVAAMKDEVVGYVVSERRRKDISILKIVVHPDYRSQGIGRLLLRGVIGSLEHMRRTKATTMVAESGRVALTFFARCGFRAATPLVKGFFAKEDGIRMEYRYLRDLGSELQTINRIGKYYANGNDGR